LHRWCVAPSQPYPSHAAPTVSAALVPCAWPASAASTPDAWRRPLALFLAGLHNAPTPTPTPKPLPGPALTAAELGDVLQDLGPHRTP